MDREGSKAVMGIKGVSILSQSQNVCHPTICMPYWREPSRRTGLILLTTVKPTISDCPNQAPPTKINQAPRSLELLSFWKASVFRARMLYYSLPLLKAFLLSEYIHHLALLISARQNLLSEAIPTTSIDIANEML